MTRKHLLEYAQPEKTFSPGGILFRVCAVLGYGLMGISGAAFLVLGISWIILVATSDTRITPAVIGLVLAAGGTVLILACIGGVRGVLRGAWRV